MVINEYMHMQAEKISDSIANTAIDKLIDVSMGY